jgi:hypothetical protein
VGILKDRIKKPNHGVAEPGHAIFAGSISHAQPPFFSGTR